jgi:hypothetical protein
MPRYGRREYDEGYDDGYNQAYREIERETAYGRRGAGGTFRVKTTRRKAPARKKARKLTAWNRYVKNKKNHIKMRDGKLNLKKMAVQFRKKKR